MKTPPHERFVYYESLKASGVLDTATRDAVAELLGPPDWEGNATDGHQVHYILQSRHPTWLNWDSVMFLDIRFNEQGQVKRYFVRGD